MGKMLLNGTVVTPLIVKGAGTKINNQDITVTENGTYTAEDGYTGLGTVDVQVPNPSAGTLSIVENGSYDVTEYATAEVNVPTGGGGAPATLLGISIDDIVEVKDGVVNIPDKPVVLDFAGVTEIKNYTFYHFFSRNFMKSGWIKNVSDITKLGSNAFGYFFGSGFQAGIEKTKISFDSLEALIYGSEFRSFGSGNLHLDPIERYICFPALKVISSEYAFNSAFNCNGSSLVSEGLMDELFPVLEKISGRAAMQGIITFNAGQIFTYSKAKKITGDNSKVYTTLQGSSKQNLVWKFPRATEMAGYVWNMGASYAGEIHFAAANQAAIEACDKFAEKWGFAGATIFFDLMLNITVNGVLYSRNRIIDGYTSWEDESGNLVYTDMTTEPAVGTPVYSDAGITQIGTVTEVA